VKAIRQHLNFSNVVACAALFLALGGSAWAVTKNSVGTKQLKNNAVTAKKIKKNAVTTAKIKNGAVTGKKVKLSSLGKVPSAKVADSATTAGSATTAESANTAESATNAESADLASSLKDQENVFLKMNGGETTTVIQNGDVSITAECVKNDDGGDYIDLYGATTADGAVMAGNDDLGGGATPNQYLNVNTLPEDREFAAMGNATGVTYVGNDIDAGFVLGPDGKMITSNTEGVALGLNYLGADCVVAGIFNKISQ
jgi:hypothetical protein